VRSLASAGHAPLSPPVYEAFSWDSHADNVMAQWSSFYPRDDFQPEIVVGMYDRWLSQLGSGPTQAERALVHTPMMDLAHERRFAISEMEQSMTDFELEHRRCIGQYIDHLQMHFSNHPADKSEDSVLRQPRALIELDPLPAESKLLDPFPDTNPSLDTVVPPLEQVLELLLSTSVPQVQSTIIEMPPKSPLSADESGTISDRSVKFCIEEIKTLSKQSRRLIPKGPRQQKVIQLRKKAARSHRNESDESDADPQLKRARR